MRVAGRVDEAEISPPFRIMPSRPRNLVGPGALASLGLALIAWGIWSASAKSEGSGLEAIALVVGVFMAPIGLVWLLRERRYFDPRNEYWIEIGLDDFALVRPDGFERSPWADLSAFDVKKTTHRRDIKIGKVKVGEEETYSYDAVARYGGLEVQIPLNDFATKLANDEEGRAKAICDALNKFRQEALSRQAGNPANAVQIPAGLVIAAIPPARKAPLVVKNSVVQRP